MARIDTQLADNPFLAGANFTIADITAFIAIEFGARAEISIPDGCANVARWFDSVASRASASA